VLQHTNKYYTSVINTTFVLCTMAYMSPVKENELWRIRRNDELEAIIKGENIVRFIKCQRIR